LQQQPAASQVIIIIMQREMYDTAATRPTPALAKELLTDTLGYKLDEIGMQREMHAAAIRSAPALAIKLLTDTLGYELDETGPSETSLIPCKRRYRVYVPCVPAWLADYRMPRLMNDIANLMQQVFDTVWRKPIQPCLSTSSKVPSGGGGGRAVQHCLVIWDAEGSSKECEFVYTAGPRPRPRPSRGSGSPKM
jgi:hypothetical protein